MIEIHNPVMKLIVQHTNVQNHVYFKKQKDNV